MLLNPEVLGPEYLRLFPNTRREPLCQSLNNSSMRKVKRLRDASPLPFEKERKAPPLIQKDVRPLRRKIEDSSDSDDDLPLSVFAARKKTKDPLDESALKEEDKKTIRLFRSLIDSKEYRAAEDLIDWANHPWKVSLIQREFVRWYVNNNKLDQAREITKDVSIRKIKKSCQYLIDNK